MQISFKDQDGKERTVSVVKPAGRCSHRSNIDPLPCAMPTCAAGPGGALRMRLTVEIEDTEGKRAYVYMKRKLNSQSDLWEWVPV